MNKILLALLLTTTSASVLANESLNWNGPYVGANVGYGWGEQKFNALSFDGYSAPDVAYPTTNRNPNLDSAFGGIQTGYNFKMNNTLLGVDLGIVGGSFDANYQSTTGNYSAKSEMNWISTVKAKVGMFVNDTLIYTNGGLALGREKVDLYDNYEGVTINTSNSQTRTGWVIGLGVEHPISNNITAKIDYQHIDFGNQKFTLNEGGGDYWESINVKTSDKFDILSIGLNYHF